MTAVPKDERYRFDGFDLPLQKRELTGTDGRAVELATAGFNLLELFVKRPPRDDARQHCGPLKGHEWSPLDRSIDTLVGRLRKKIEAGADHPKLIKTVRGVGYVFTAEFEKA